MDWEDRDCKYCSRTLPIALAEKFNHTAIINGRVGALEISEDWDYINDDFSNEVDEIEINYCPMCGRKF